jgi:hypothetical protein
VLRTSRLIRTLAAVSVACAVTGAAIWIHGSPPDRGTTQYRAVFHDAGGVRTGADVVVNGSPIGEVSRVQLLNGNAVLTLAVDAGVQLGTTTTAAVRPETGSAPAKIELRSCGPGKLQPGDSIPLQRTTSFSPSAGTTDPSASAHCRAADTVINNNRISARHVPPLPPVNDVRMSFRRANARRLLITVHPGQLRADDGNRLHVFSLGR